MNSTAKTIAVVGGGVAGLLASITAASRGAHVILFEDGDYRKGQVQPDQRSAD